MNSIDSYIPMVEVEDLVIYLTLSGESQLIKTIANQLVGKCYSLQIGCIDDKAKLVEGFQKRELEASTGLEDGFAIPHARIKEIKKPAVIFVRYQTGIKWATFDNSDVKVVIALIISTNKASDIHLEILSSIAKKLLDSEIRAKLKTLTDKIAVLKILTATNEKSQWKF